MTPTRIAVLGGGAGALAAAFQLTEDFPREEVEITVYTRGWRLGGKGASGRDASRHHRIEEHGLHVWFGFYDEAFDLMAKAYEAAGEDAPYADTAAAFTPIEHLALWDGLDARYRLALPSDGLQPERRPQHALNYGAGFARWALAVYRARRDAVRPIAGLAWPEPPDDLVALSEGGGRGLLERWTLRMAAATLRGAHGWAVEHIDDPQLQAFYDVFAAMLTLMDSGELLDEHGGWCEENIAKINEHDFRDWLRPELEQPDQTLAAPFLRALYDLAFAYPDGRRPESVTEGAPAGRIAAGVYLRGILRIFAAHRGSMMLRMNGGMGDVVFAPLYHALRARGVHFEFFCAVEAVEPGADGSVDRVRLVRQAQTVTDANGARPGYAPLSRPAGGQWAWPNQPHWEQLDVADHERVHDFDRELDPLGGERVTLRAGEHFEEIVLGIPPIALGDGGEALAGASACFRSMLEGMHTVATQALQLWLTLPTAELGLAKDPMTISGAYAPPFDTFIDMSQLLAPGIEPWPEDSAVESVAYFCGVLDEDDAKAPDALERVRAHAGRFLSLHPWAQELGEALADGDGQAGGLLEDQYVRANTHGSDRYVLSLPGTIATRLQPGNSGFANLVLAGDWTRSSVDAGCVEAAVCSGHRAAEAIVTRRRGTA